MKHRVRIGTVALVALVSAAAAFAENVTVGHFYKELAQAKQLKANDAASAEASLRGAGYQLPTIALNKGLTEGDMTAIAKAIGVTVSTSRPSQPVGETQLDTFIASFKGQIGAPPVANSTPTGSKVEGDPGNSGNGKGLKKGHHKSSSEPQ